MLDELLKKAKVGDVQAMEEIVNRLQPLLVASIKRYYNRAEEYDDLMQDGNLMIIESVYDYDSNRGVHFLGYIKSKIKFLYLNKYKRKTYLSLNATIGDGPNEIIDLLVEEDVNILKEILIKEEKEKVKEMLKILTPRQRQVIDLYYGENKSIGEIGKNLGIAYRTVVNTKTGALKKLKIKAFYFM